MEKIENMSLITQSAKYITSENLLLDSIKCILICISLFLYMAKATKVNKDEPVLRRRSTLVSVQDKPTSKLVQDDPVSRRQSALVSVQDLKLVTLQETLQETCDRVSKSKIYIEEYSPKSFVVRGKTQEYKDNLKEFGGKWNPHLTDKQNGCKFGGWIFSKSKIPKVTAWIGG